MAEVRVLVNGNEYTEDQFRKDLIRMLDAYRDKDAQMGVPECYGVECNVCPLCKNSCCERRTTNSFKTIGIVYEWAIEHQAMTNQKKLEEVFGIWIEPTIVIGSENKDEYEKPLNFEFLFMKNGDHTVLARFKEKNNTFWSWLNEEYKEPKGEKKNG